MKRAMRTTLVTILFLCFAAPLMHAQGGPYGEWPKGCDAGDGAACDKMGMWNEFGGPSWPPDAAKASAWYSRALAIYRRNCDSGKMGDCTSLGLMYFAPRGVAKDDAQAVTLYRKGCGGGDMRGCTFLGSMYRDGKGVSKDNAQAVEHFRKACDGGNAFGCKSLGDAYDSGEGVTQNKAKAVELYRKACASDDKSSACDTLKELEGK